MINLISDAKLFQVSSEVNDAKAISIMGKSDKVAFGFIFDGWYNADTFSNHSFKMM